MSFIPLGPAVQSVVIPTVLVPGGVFPMGSHDFEDAPPTWKEVSDCEIGETVVTFGQFKAVMGKTGDVTDECPANKFSYVEAEEFVLRLNAGLPVGEAPYRIPTEAELEWGGRGGASVDVRALMQAEGIEPTHQNLVALAQDKLAEGSGHGLLENFVIGDWPRTAEKRQVEGIRIYTVTASEIEAALRNPELPIRAMWMYASGRAGLTMESVWYGRLRPAPHAKWGQPNRLGLFTMSGNLWVWAADGYEKDAYEKTAARDPYNKPKRENSDRVRRGGGDWLWVTPKSHFRTACRERFHPNDPYGIFGLRVARSVA